MTVYMYENHRLEYVATHKKENYSAIKNSVHFNLVTIGVFWVRFWAKNRFSQLPFRRYFENLLSEKNLVVRCFLTIWPRQLVLNNFQPQQINPRGTPTSYPTFLNALYKLDMFWGCFIEKQDSLTKIENLSGNYPIYTSIFFVDATNDLVLEPGLIRNFLQIRSASSKRKWSHALTDERLVTDEVCTASSKILVRLRNFVNFGVL